MVHESNTNVYYCTSSELVEMQEKIAYGVMENPFKLGDRIYVVDLKMWVIAGNDELYDYREPDTANTHYTPVGG